MKASRIKLYDGDEKIFELLINNYNNRDENRHMSTTSNNNIEQGRSCLL